MTVPTVVELPDELPPPAAVIGEEETVSYRRSPSDVLRVLVLAGATVVLLILSTWAEDAILGFEEDAIALLTFLTPTAERILAGLMQVVLVIIGVAYLLIPLATRRYRLFGYVVAASLVASISVRGIEWWLDRESPVTLVNEVAERAGLDDDLLTPWGLAQLVAVFVVLAPFVSRRWRRSCTHSAVLTGVPVSERSCAPCARADSRWPSSSRLRWMLADRHPTSARWRTAAASS